MSLLVFMDTETTGLSIHDDIWEFAAVKRREDGTESTLHLFIEHDERKCRQLPDSFRSDHNARFPKDEASVASKSEAAKIIGAFFGTSRPHVIGAVPNFDTERVSRLLRIYGAVSREPWHYHLIDVENLAVGYLAGVAKRAIDEADMRGEEPPNVHFERLSPPWNSDDLSRACGIEPPTTARHTAMGDVKWAMALYDAITGQPGTHKETT